MPGMATCQAGFSWIHHDPRRGQMSHLPCRAELDRDFACAKVAELRSAGQMRTSAPTCIVVVSISVVKLLPDVCPADSRGVRTERTARGLSAEVAGQFLHAQFH